MGLTIIFANSPQCYLDEILNSILKDHAIQKPDADYRIIVPQANWVEDLEHFFLNHPLHSGVNIGQTIYSIQNWTEQNLTQDDLLRSAITKMELRYFFNHKNIQEQIKSIAISSSQLAKAWLEYRKFKVFFNSPQTTYDRLFELNKLFEQFLNQYQLRDTCSALTNIQIANASTLSPSLIKIKTFYFLGFYDLQPELVYWMDTLRAHPEFEIFLTLPNLSQLQDPQELRSFVLHRWMQQAKIMNAEKQTSYIKKNHILPSTAHLMGALQRQINHNLNQNHETFILLEPGLECNDLLLEQLYQQRLLCLMPQVPQLAYQPMWHQFIKLLASYDFDASDIVLLLKKTWEAISLVAIQESQLLVQQQLLSFLNEVLHFFNKYQLQFQDCEQLISWLQSELLSLHPVQQLETSYPLFLRNIQYPGIKPRLEIHVLTTQQSETNFLAHPILKQLQIYKNQQAELLNEYTQSLAIETIYVWQARYNLNAQELGIEEENNIPLPHYANLLPMQCHTQLPLSNYDDNETLSLKLSGTHAIAVKEALSNKIETVTYNASQINTYAKCHWRYFARYFLKLQLIEDDELIAGKMPQGQWLHQILEFIYRTIEAPQFWKQDFFEISQWALKQFLQYKKQHHSEILSEQSSSYAYYEKKILEQVVSILKTDWGYFNNGGVFYPHQFELQFGYNQQIPIVYQGQHGSYAFRGKIDRIDYDPDSNSALIIDYKTGGKESHRKNLRDLLDFQLAIYLLAIEQMFPKQHIAGALYYSAKDLDRQTGLAKKSYAKQLQISNQNKSVIEDDNWQTLLQSYYQNMETTIVQMKNADFSLEPKQCQATCEYWEVCRYPYKEKSF